MNSIQTIIYYAPLIIILFWGLSIGISIYKPKNSFKLPFLFFLLDAFFSIYLGATFHNHHYRIYQELYFLGAFTALSMFPLFHLFILSLTVEQGIGLNDYFRHLLFPFICMLIASVALVVFGDTALRYEFVSKVLAKNIIESDYMQNLFYMDKAFRMSFIIIALIYFTLTERRLKKHKEEINNYFSNTEDATVNWYSYFRIAFALTVVAGVIYYLLDRSTTLENRVASTVSHSFLAIFFWGTGYFVALQKRIYPKVTMDKKPRGELINDTLHQIEFKLEREMAEKKLFTNSHLTLPELAQIIGTNRTYMSRMFSTYLNTNFNSYINLKRVEYSKKLLQESDLPINHIAFECGFNSVSNFYRVFSDVVGITPSKFRSSS